MSHAPRDWSGFVTKRYLNAIRTREAVDPFYSQVRILAPLSGNPGDLPLDLGPNAVPATLQNPAASGYTFEMNSDVPLFGLNTLYANRPGALDFKYFSFADAAAVFDSSQSFCWEGWILPINVPGNVIPSCAMYTPSAAFSFAMWPGNNLRIRVGQSLSRFKNVTFGVWHYFAAQYIGVPGGVGNFLVSIDGALVNATPLAIGAAINSVGFELQIGFNQNGLGSSGDFEWRLGQLRYTMANRYGTSPAPIPSGPWPTRGP